MEEKPYLPGSRLKKLTCPSCHKTFEHEPVKAHGDPRNVAYILHWDGFQRFPGKENHGCGALEVQIATMCKEDRCKSEVFVVGFVPCYVLPNKRPLSLDPFHAPFIEEIETGFIEGIEVNYSLDTPWEKAGPTNNPGQKFPGQEHEIALSVNIFILHILSQSSTFLLSCLCNFWKGPLPPNNVECNWNHSECR